MSQFSAAIAKLREWDASATWPCPDSAECHHESDLRCLIAALEQEAS